MERVMSIEQSCHHLLAMVAEVVNQEVVRDLQQVQGSLLIYQVHLHCHDPRECGGQPLSIASNDNFWLLFIELVLKFSQEVLRLGGQEGLVHLELVAASILVNHNQDGINSPLAQGEISLCVCFTKHVWKKPNTCLCGFSHTCLVISTLMCNKTHLCGESHRTKN